MHKKVILERAYYGAVFRIYLQRARFEMHSNGEIFEGEETVLDEGSDDKPQIILRNLKFVVLKACLRWITRILRAYLLLFSSKAGALVPFRLTRKTHDLNTQPHTGLALLDEIDFEAIRFRRTIEPLIADYRLGLGTRSKIGRNEAFVSRTLNLSSGRMRSFSWKLTNF